MSCIKCNSPEPEFSFDVLEVHTLHVRDFTGERLIQALGDKNKFEVCAACAQSELQAVRFPAGRIFRECWGFAVLGLLGIVLTFALSFRDVMNALRIIGPLCVFVGVSGTIGKVREALTAREEFSVMSGDKALKSAAWGCVLRHAPHKFNDNDITYIPCEAASPEELAVKYNLLAAIARKASEVLKNE